MDQCTTARVCSQNLQLRLPGDSARTPSVSLFHTSCMHEPSAACELAILSDPHRRLHFKMM